MKKSILLSAVRKCKRISSNYYGGPLTPSEILALVELKVKPTSDNVWWYEEKYKKGISGSYWFYFNANKDFKKLKGD